MVMIRIVALAAFAGMLSSCVFNVEEDTENLYLRTSALGYTRFKLDNAATQYGGIRVRGIEKDSVLVGALLRGLSLDDETEAGFGVVMKVSGEGSEAVLSFDAPDDRDWSRVSVENVSIDMLRTLETEVNSISGDVNVAQMYGYVKVENVSGDVSVETRRGVRVKSVSGDITVSLTDGNGYALDEKFGGIDIDVTSGDVLIKVPVFFSSRLELKTTSGDITVPGDSQSMLNGGHTTNVISVKTVSGDITITKK